MKISLQLTFLSLLLIFSSAYAVNVGHLYQAKVAIANMSEQARDAAIQDAMRQVIVKVSGDSDSLNNDMLKAQLSQANQYVDQYSYIDNKTVSSDGVTQHHLFLNVVFDKPSMSRLLQVTKTHVWGRQRPLTLVWLVSQTANGQDIISNNDALAQTVNQAANYRGLPVLLPVMDLQDLNNISSQEIWDFDNPAIEKASQRYGVDAILVGHVSVNAQGQWQGQWESIDHQHTKKWQTTGTTVKQVIQASIDKQANSLATQFQVQGVSGEDWVSLTVMGIKSFQDYGHIKQYLEKLAVVENLETTSIEPSYVVFHIGLSGDVNQLTQSLALDQKLAPFQSGNSNSNAKDNSPTANLIYQWTS